MAMNDASPQAGSYQSNNSSSNSPSTPSQSPASQLPDFSGLQIKPELFVKPDLFTLYFGFFGSSGWQRSAKSRISGRLEGIWALTGRNPTQIEVDAFTEHTTRGLYYGRAGIPVSTFIGAAWMYNKGRETFPAGSTAKDRVSFMRQMWFTQRKEFMSLTSKTAFRLLFIGTLGGIVSSMASAYVNVNGALSDPRLEVWRHDSKNQKEEDIRKRKMQLVSETYNRSRKSAQDQIQVGSGGYDSASEARGNESMSGFDSVQSQQQQYGYDGSNESPGKYQSRPSQPQPSSSDFFGSDDDASPTAPEYRSTNPDGSAMSSWDRIRQQNGSSKPQPLVRQPPQAWGQLQNQPRPDPTPAGAQDRYDNDRNREREQAQADFDRMMEAERNASEESTSRRGWGS
ncbi:hypothetical protein N7454_002496 [Penicillium verhagenii]|nr:hypothetical protein N7454_002496 [Penicillium verhagenii]